MSEIVGAEKIDSPLELSFRNYWEMQRAGRSIPERAQFTPESLFPWLGHILIVDVIDGGRDFFYRIVGTEIVSAAGRDLSRKYVSECDYDIGTEAMLTRYRNAAAQESPIFRKGAIQWAVTGTFLDFESITAPVSRGRQSVDQLITVIDYSDPEFRAIGRFSI